MISSRTDWADVEDNTLILVLFSVLSPGNMSHCVFIST